MNTDWDPQQYHKFKEQRARPFFDLMSLVKPPVTSVLDLGCGTGELTQILHTHFKCQNSLAIDSSEKMLMEARRNVSREVLVEKHDIVSFEPREKFDLVFSNAALQWVAEHKVLLPKILSWIKGGGQVAMQMPYNFDHLSHKTAADVAAEMFPDKFVLDARWDYVLDLAEYAEILYEHGFTQQICRIQVYEFVMESGFLIIEWVKGTLLNFYKKQLAAEEYKNFEDEYRRRILSETGNRPYFYPFKRMLVWGMRS